VGKVEFRIGLKVLAQSQRRSTGTGHVPMLVLLILRLLLPVLVPVLLL